MTHKCVMGLNECTQCSLWFRAPLLLAVQSLYKGIVANFGHSPGVSLYRIPRKFSEKAEEPLGSPFSHEACSLPLVQVK